MLLQGAVEGALADLNEALKLDPKNSGSLIERSRCRVAQGTDLAAALADADEAVRLDPNNPFAYGQRAAVRSARGEWADGRKDLDEGLRLGPNVAALYVARANLLACCPEEAERNFPRAFKDAERACELTDWNDPYALEAIAAAAAALRDFAGAVKWQKRALDDPHYAKFSPTGRARLAAFEGRSVITFPPPILDKADARQYVARGNHFYRTGDLDYALADFEEAIRLDPKSAKAFYGRGCVRAKRDEVVKAVADLSEAIRLDPTDVSAFVDRSVVLVMRGEWELALADCDAALKLDPKHVAALTDRAMIRATCADPAYRDAAQALKDARRACDLTGWKLGYPLEGYAAACAEAGDFDEAVKWASRAALDDEYARRRGRIVGYHVQMYEAKKPLRTGKPRKPD
jgi:tetratricopeptide (TPR) repeat protein